MDKRQKNRTFVDSLEDITIKGERLGELLRQEVIKEIDLLKPSTQNDDELNKCAIARSFLMAGQQLNLQIYKAVKDNSLLMALCGLRTILEYDIKSNFIFDHPLRFNNLDWIHVCTNDVMKTTNDLGEWKSKINNFGLNEMANQVNRSEIAMKNYAALSDYTHLPVRSADIYFWEEDKYKEISVAVLSSSLVHLSGIVASIGNHIQYIYIMRN